MTIALRPHHLLCLLTYIGRGYSPGFVENYDRLAARLGSGEAIAIVDGPDAICAPILDAPDSHCRIASVIERDRLAALAVAEALGTPIAPGMTLILDPPRVATLRKHFAQGTIRAACTGCEWQDLCSSIAQTGFEGVKIPNACL